MARLNDLVVKKAKPGRHTDGDGLMLVVSESGARSGFCGIRRERRAATRGSAGCEPKLCN